MTQPHPRGMRVVHPTVLVLEEHCPDNTSRAICWTPMFLGEVCSRRDHEGYCVGHPNMDVSQGTAWDAPSGGYSLNPWTCICCNGIALHAPSKGVMDTHNSLLEFLRQRLRRGRSIPRRRLLILEVGAAILSSDGVYWRGGCFAFGSGGASGRASVGRGGI